MQQDIEKDEAKFEFWSQRDEIYAVASLLKVGTAVLLVIRDPNLLPALPPRIA